MSPSSIPRRCDYSKSTIISNRLSVGPVCFALFSASRSVLRTSSLQMCCTSSSPWSACKCHSRLGRYYAILTWPVLHPLSFSSLKYLSFSEFAQHPRNSMISSAALPPTGCGLPFTPSLVLSNGLVLLPGLAVWLLQPFSLSSLLFSTRLPPLEARNSLGARPWEALALHRWSSSVIKSRSILVFFPWSRGIGTKIGGWRPFVKRMRCSLPIPGRTMALGITCIDMRHDIVCCLIVILYLYVYRL